MHSRSPGVRSRESSIARRQRERFERAIGLGHTAGLLGQERRDIFTQAARHIPANEALVARITIHQCLVWLPEGEWELRFPTVIGLCSIAVADTAADVRAGSVRTSSLARCDQSEPALDRDGLSSTAHAVLARIKRAR